MNPLFARAEIQLLMNLTAKAFGEKPLRVWSMPRDRALSAYAESTCRWMSQSAKPAYELETGLRRAALGTGRRIHRLAFFLDERQLSRLVIYLYSGIGIDMRGSLPGEVVIPSCFFAAYYTPGMCALMSSMDDGIVSGIMGGGRLRFTRRLTGGCTSCAACLERSNTHER